MKILNPKNEIIGKVEQDKKDNKFVPFNYRYVGNNNITFPVYANSIAAACSQVCKFFGEGYFFLMFTI